MPIVLSPIGKVIETCLVLDRFSANMYQEFSSVFQQPDLARVWKSLAIEEGNHVKFWEQLLEMAMQGDMPELFEDAGTTLSELDAVRLKGVSLMARFQENPTIENAFLTACRMEFYLLHPALADLFVFARSFSEKFILADTYNIHIQRFIAAFRKHGSGTAEMDMMSESMERLWRQNRVLSRLGTLDELTGVLNRRGFFNAVKPLANMAQRTGDEVGVLIADVDDFKKINDTHGHLKGDDVLKALGRALQNAGRASDVTGRYGGEEFIIFFPGIQRHSLIQIAEKFRLAVAEETKTAVPATVSIGVAEGGLSEDTTGDLLNLIKRADDALYRAKKEGKNRVVSDG